MSKPKAHVLTCSVEDRGRLDHLSEKHMDLSRVGISCSSPKRCLGQKGVEELWEAGEKRSEVQTLLQLVPARLCLLVHSRAVSNRDGDVKLGLVSSARKGNSRDY